MVAYIVSQISFWYKMQKLFWLGFSQLCYTLIHKIAAVKFIYS